MKQIRLEEPLKVRNVDGTLNKTGTVTHYVELDLNINGRTKRHRLMITGLGKEKIILGLPWFEEENPNINWQLRTLEWRTPETKTETTNRQMDKIEISSPEDPTESHLSIGMIDLMEELLPEQENDLWIQAKITASQTFSLQHEEKKKEQTLEEIIPPEYHDYMDIFDKKTAD